ncbi:SDR family NAD(P)-dependent oxidoreductase [Rhizobium sp. TRM96647]|uniref:SDR family NAD(P)-dependent oxidoreductase n=1 Tax=unclassified Rhizobium TaxID=2613769 RepID=UPI0021E7C3F3|nr:MULTISPECIES: SDR family NAD(P)-dependent oxidoreductase [unclassified Rhizobium]MCV3737504.1 SDR family NAD(P)-dependent oxidoreductase [Rhizobium sp. TRM96647]MCV3756406.1 SDR family NAD(P)-dependent oxidoreductase [Rhizobium sp. TRM96650]
MIDVSAVNRPAVVVVGASRGIGRSIARVAAREGGPIVLVARSREGLSDVAAEMRAAGAEPFTVTLDLMAMDAAQRLQAELDRNGLYCDVLVNSAGIGLRGAATLLSVQDQIGIVDLNIRALSELTLHFLKGMAARKRGGVLNLGSIASFTPGPGMAMYYASKGFVRSFSEALHTEMRPIGVTVTCACPGPVATEFLELSGAGKSMLFKVLPRLEPDYVAERAWRGFRTGRRLVIPGISAKLTALASSVVPSALMLPLIARLQRRSGDLCPCGSGKRYGNCCGK